MENWDGIFLDNKHAQIGKKNEELSMATTVSFSRNGRNYILNENETLNPRAGN